MPAAPREQCVCTALSCVASCGKVRSHPLLQRGETSASSSRVAAEGAWESPCPLRSTCLHCRCRVPHRWETHHGELCLQLGVCNLPWSYLPSTPGTTTLGHLWLVSTSSWWCGGSALPLAQPWGAKAMCAGPQVTNCCLQLFLLSMEMCFLQGEYIGVLS